MIAYILKTIVCSGLLWLFYYLFLQKEKLYRYNRMYLLLSIAISFIVPFITISYSKPVPVITEFIPFAENNFTGTTTQPIHSTTSTGYFTFVPLALYILVTSLLLFRFIKNTLCLFLKIRRNKVIKHPESKIVLTNEWISPHSFLHYIFLNKEAYEKSSIEKEIVQHELAHVKQKHSLDILLLELVLIVAWFNPFLFLYKKAIQLNHEFLADEAVLKKYNDRAGYQHLLLNKASLPTGLTLSSPFNYLLIKKRFLMMTKQTSPASAIARQIAMLPLLLLTGFLFSTSTTVEAQEKQAPPKGVQKPPYTIESTREGISQQELNEYHNIINKYKKTKTKWFLDFINNITPAEQDRLEELFKKMSKEQQANEEVVFMPPPKPFEKIVPTSQQLESFKNGAVYGVWIDGRRIKNEELSNFSPENFSHVFISRLLGAAKKPGGHSFQVDLMTNNYYQDYFKKAKAQKRYTLAHAWKRQPVK